MTLTFIKKNRLVVSLSDKLRSMRFAIRNLKFMIDKYEDDDKNAIPLIGAVSALTNASDKALTNVEHTVHSHLSSDLDKHMGLATACSLVLYVMPRNTEQKILSGNALPSDRPPIVYSGEVALQFAGDQYFTAKRIALAFNLDHFLLKQTLFLACWDELAIVLSSKLIKDKVDLTDHYIYHVCAEYVDILYRHSIVVFPKSHVDPQDDSTYDTNILLAITIALVTSVTTYSDVHGLDTESDQIYRNCIVFIRSRYSMLEKVFLGDNNTHDIEDFLAIWTPRLT